MMCFGFHIQLFHYVFHCTTTEYIQNIYMISWAVRYVGFFNCVSVGEPGTPRSEVERGIPGYASLLIPSLKIQTR
jgi:hypothetical protein